MNTNLINKWDKSTDLIDDDSMRPTRYGMAGRYIKRFTKNIKLLDLGCGEGSGLVYLNKSGYKHTFGVEVSPERLRRAHKKLPTTTNLKKLMVNENLPFKNELFDVIVSLVVIEHTENPLKYLSEIKRVLKKNGHVIISSDCYLWRLLQLVHLYNSVQPIDKAFNPIRIIQIFKESGFEIKHIDTFNLPERGNIYLDIIRSFCRRPLKMKRKTNDYNFF
jgi:ubiquinone/menaquinone biosynthesis C-methylase UbiE